MTTAAANPTTDPAADSATVDAADPDVTTPSLYLRGAPHERFAEMRARTGLTWHPYESSGFWAVTRHSDIKEASKRAKEFSSGVGALQSLGSGTRRFGGTSIHHRHRPS